MHWLKLIIFFYLNSTEDRVRVLQCQHPEPQLYFLIKLLFSTDLLISPLTKHLVELIDYLITENFVYFTLIELLHLVELLLMIIQQLNYLLHLNLAFFHV